MSILTDFYAGKTVNVDNLKLMDVLLLTNEQLEVLHSWVQWIFPLTEPSNFNPTAPLLTTEDMKEFRSNILLRTHLHLSYHRFLHFLGLVEINGEVVQGKHFKEQQYIWMRFNHNFLRITRCLTSLALLGARDKAENLYKCLGKMRSQYPISENTFSYWTESLTEPKNI